MAPNEAIQVRPISGALGAEIFGVALGKIEEAGKFLIAG